MEKTEITMTTNSMDPRLLSRGPSFISFSRTNSEISTSPLLPADSRPLSPDPVDRGESPSKSRYKIPAPIDQFFKGAELGKWLLTLDGGALVALMGFHQQDSALLPKQYVGPLVVLLMIGFCALFSGLLFQESCPEFAVAAVIVGAACVVANFLTMIAAILPVNLDVVVWAAFAPMAALLLALLWVIAKKGMRERVVDTRHRQARLN